jgi:signal transduction histidine kinase
MAKPLPLDAIDARVVLNTYAVVVGVASIVMVTQGTMATFDGHGPRDEWPMLVAGALALASAIPARALATIDAAFERRRMLGWFIVSQGVVLIGAGLAIQFANPGRTFVDGVFVPGRMPTVDVRPLVPVMTGMAFMWLWLFFGWGKAGGDPSPFAALTAGLFSSTRRLTFSERLRSDYERQMREAGAQEERNRLARDLHDSVKQQIFAIHTSAATAEARLGLDEAGTREALTQVRVAAKDSMAEMDAMLDQLRSAPLENTSLADAIRRQCEAVRLRTGANVTCQVDAMPPGEALPPGAHGALLRIVQEALSNIARHARATSVGVTLTTGGPRVELTIVDNGTGYDAATTRAGLGLESMNARANEMGGEAHLVSKPGEGTTVFVTVPFTHEDPNYYRKMIWMRVSVLAAVAAFLLFIAREHSFGMILIGAVTLVDLVRYVIAWRRALRLRARTA